MTCKNLFLVFILYLKTAGRAKYAPRTTLAEILELLARKTAVSQGYD